VLFGGGQIESASGPAVDNVDFLKLCLNDADCNDNIFCNGKEICQNGWCLSTSTGDPCLNGTTCNNGMCNETAKNCFSPEYSSCSDGIFCNGEEVCIQGTCIATELPCENNTNPCNTCQESLKICYITYGSICPLSENQCGKCNSNGTCLETPGTNCASQTNSTSTILVHAKTNNVPIIVGVIVGAVALLTIVAIVFYLLKRQRPSPPYPLGELEGKKNVDVILWDKELLCIY
jgi:hypothetical protein